MEKLLKLLNQFEKARIEAVNAKGLPYNIKLSFRPYTEETLTNKAYKGCQLEICSKYYRFIEWLVRENKIDRDNQALQYAKSDLSKFFTEWRDKNGMSDDCTMLLMLLAIQDSPIELLISILR